MKVTKTEKIWLVLVVVFYFLYNLPYFPAYEQAVPTLVHAALTVIPLWIIIYVGMARVYKIYRLKSDETMGTLEEDPADRAESAAGAVVEKAEEIKKEVTDNG